MKSFAAIAIVVISITSTIYTLISNYQFIPEPPQYYQELTGVTS